jgi:hypothetical protein
MTEWKKIPSKLQSARKKAPYYLEVREGVYRTSYRVRFRGEGIELEEVLDGDFKDWTEALKEADRLIAKARFGEKETPKDLIRTESVISQLLSETDGQDRATIDIKNNIFLKHITPWVNESMAYASTITVASWPAYKKFKRQERATIALENHYKYFAMLARRIWELGIIKNKVRISFDVKKEDFRKKGLVIPDDHFALMVQAATPKNFMKVPRIQPKWRDRIILQRRTGLRPGEARDLEKSRVILRTDFAIIDIPAEDSKTDIPRKFKVRHPDVRTSSRVRWIPRGLWIRDSRVGTGYSIAPSRDCRFRSTRRTTSATPTRRRCSRRLTSTLNFATSST